MNINDAKELVVEAGIRLLKSGLIARTWGNVSCRVDEESFVITPSGRDYLTLGPEDIVRVTVKDCSWTGDIKPSSEKGIHAGVYRLRKDIGFVIHTHQKYASAVSAAGVPEIPMGTKVPCADYALPGTKRLLQNVVREVASTKGNGVIMKNHGALCYGKDHEEAFDTAAALEAACSSFLAGLYLAESGMQVFDEDLMRSFEAERLSGKGKIDIDFGCRPLYEGRRTAEGFTLVSADGREIAGGGPKDEGALWEAELYRSVFQSRRNINHIIHAVTPDIIATAYAGITIRPFLDDFAQLAGTAVKTVQGGVKETSAALKNAQAVFISKRGALCCGSTRSEAEAVAMVVDKNCGALLASALTGKGKPLNPLECILMRQVYLKKYSRLQPSKQNLFELR